MITKEINIDITNPGQFFACCGLLELTNRFNNSAVGYFQNNKFILQYDNDENILNKIINLDIEIKEPTNKLSSPLEIKTPIPIILDWYNNKYIGGTSLKTWAGRMDNFTIAKSMQTAMKNIDNIENIFEYSDIINIYNNPKSKIEPYYFDSRRGGDAHPLDIGFSPDQVQIKMKACPALEFLCLVGLQRCMPKKTSIYHQYIYQVWNTPMPIYLLGMVTNVSMKIPNSKLYSFYVNFRTGQKKHKAFSSATLIQRNK